MNRFRRKSWALAALLGTGTLFQLAIPSSCIEFGAQTALTSLNVCAVLNCAEGTYFNFCTPVAVFVDCLDP